MRDALSIFDRIVSFSNETITAQHVSVNLSILDFDTYLHITKDLIEGNIREVILSFDKILSKGFDGHHFIVGLASHLRDLWMCRHKDTVELLEVGEATKKKFLEQSEKASLDFLEKSIALANACDLSYKSSKNQRLHVELCLMQIASATDEKKKSKPYIKPPTKRDQKPTITQKKQAVVKEKPAIVVEETAKAVKTDTAVEEVPTPAHTEVKSPTTTDKQVDENPIELNIKLKGVSGLSLSSIAIQKSIKANQPSNGKSKRDQKFGQERLEDAWKQLSFKLESEGEYNLAALLNLDIPRLKNKTEIHLNFPNKTNKVELESEKAKVLEALGDELKNDLLTLVIQVNEEEQKNYIYTPKDKYEQLVKINPVVDDIRKEFDLDLN